MVFLVRIRSSTSQGESYQHSLLCSYSTATEILAYFKNVVEKYDLNKYIRLEHKVVGAAWDETMQMWTVRIQKGDDPSTIFEDKAHVFVNASGVLKYVQFFSRLIYKRT